MPYGIGIALGAVSGGVNGFLSGQENNDKRKQIMSAYGNLPPVPDLQDAYLSGFYKQQGVTPGLLRNDRMLRDEFGQADIDRASNLYGYGLNKYAKANLGALKKIDPQFLAGRNQLYGVVSGDLAAGSGLTPEMQRELQQYTRGGQAARGNYLGNANIASEAFSQGAAGEQLKQQRIRNMAAFLSGPSPQDKYQNLAGVGQGGLNAATGAAQNPGFSYLEGPQNWAGQFMNAESQQFNFANQQALAQAQAYAQAPTEVNPWLSSFAGGLSGAAGAFGGGGGGGGGGMMGGGGQQKNASWSSGYNSMF